ncbi:MAG: peptidoglycan-binding domain-containing protein [Ideonella sp.]|nr:peptidoglycan-binding domain-containing protein [Ideonella sp.]
MPTRAQWWRHDAEPLGLLVERWGGPVTQGPVCERVVAESLRCFRAHASAQLIRLLDRPVMLLLQDESGAKGRMLLWGLRSDQALVQHKRRAAMGALGRIGAVLAWPVQSPWWRTSGAWAQQDSAAASQGIQAASRQLGLLPKSASGSVGDVDAALYAFQAAQGLRPDGKANVQTLMLLNRAMAVNEPRLDGER